MLTIAVSNWLRSALTTQGESGVGVMGTRYRKADQSVQPYEFGHDAFKRTCLLLKELPQLVNERHQRGTQQILSLGYLLYRSLISLNINRIRQNNAMTIQGLMEYLSYRSASPKH